MKKPQKPIKPTRPQEPERTYTREFFISNGGLVSVDEIPDEDLSPEYDWDQFHDYYNLTEYEPRFKVLDVIRWCRNKGCKDESTIVINPCHDYESGRDGLIQVNVWFQEELPQEEYERQVTKYKKSLSSFNKDAKEFKDKEQRYKDDMKTYRSFREKEKLIEQHNSIAKKIAELESL